MYQISRPKFFRSLTRFTLSAATALLVAVIAACGSDVGDGNRMEFLTVNDLSALGSADVSIDLDVVSRSASTASVFRCFPVSLVLIGTFTNGERENATSRATWTSSDTDVIQVSNGDLENLDGAVYSKGVLIPRGQPGDSATITARFLSLEATVEVTILDSHFEISPPVQEVAQGTSELFTALGILDGRQTVAATQLLDLSVENNGAAEAAFDEDSSLLRFTQGGSSDSDFIEIVGDLRLAGCEDVTLRHKVRVNDKTIHRLQVRSENFGIDPDPLEVQQVTQEGLRVFGIHEQEGDESAYFAQNLTGHILREHLIALTEEEDPLLFAEDPADPDATSFAAGFLFSDVITLLANQISESTASSTAEMVIKFDQEDDGSFLEKRFTVNVLDDQLLDLTISPASQNIFPGTSAAFQVVGRFDDGLANEDSISTQNLRRSVAWSVDEEDEELAAISNSSGFQGIAAAFLAAENGQANIDAERQDFVSGEIINASDSGGGAVLEVNDSNLTALTIEPADDQVGEGETLALKVTGNNGQDLTRSVIYTVSDTSVALVDNLSPRNGQVTGVSANATPVTVTARLYRVFTDDDGEIASTTDISASTTVTVVEGTTQEPEEPEEPEEPCLLPPLICF